MVVLSAVAWLALGATVPLVGTVVDDDGRPVAGATVWLGDTFATRQGPEVLATAETDPRGNFRLERADDLAGRGNMWSPTLWAYRPGSRVASREFKGSLPKPDEPVRLALGPPAAIALRLIRPDGEPVPGASVRLVPLTLRSPRPPDKLLDRLAATTDAEGRATIDGFAPADVFALDVTLDGQVVQCLPIDPETGVVSLRPLGRLKARVVADDPKALRGWKITARSRPTEPGYRGPYTTQWARETTGEDGRVEFPPLAAGQVLWDIDAPEGSSYLVSRFPGAMIRPGESQEVEIAVRQGIRVDGTVVEAPGGSPIPGVKVDVASLRAGSRAVRWIVTDARGHFSTVVLPGTTRFNFSFSDMPKGYFLPPGTQHWVDFEVKEGEDRHECTPPPLHKAALVRGRAVDEAGEPAAGVHVEGSWISARFGRNPNTARAETDARGEFVLGSIAPDSEVRVSASSGLVAESDPVTVPKAGEGAPITVRLRKKPTLALSGRVLGDDRRPLADVSVRVRLRPPGQRFGQGGEFAFEGPEDVRTGPDGRFRTPTQLPAGYEYRVEVQRAGFEPAVSAWVVASADAVPDLALRRSVGTREVAGRVVDSAGKPVAGAEVYQSGDGPRKTRGTTDVDGRFRVAGVPGTPSFLFVSREGYRFQGRRVDPEDRTVELALRRDDEPPASPLRPAAAPVPRDEERTIARALIDEARKAAVGVQELPELRRLPEITALVDPDRVIAMIENQVVAASPDLLTALAVGRFADDPRKSREVLDAIGPPSVASSVTLALFDRLGATAPPEFRRELLELAARRAREIEEPGPAAVELARVADRRLDLGDADLGARLVREAQARADEPRLRSPDPRSALVPALARVDLASALKLLDGDGRPAHPLDTQRLGYTVVEPEPGPDQVGDERDRLRVEVAKRIAATDPAEARRLLGMIGDRARVSARRVVAFRMAASNLPSARALAAEDHDPLVEALLPAIAARARAGTDPDGARALLRESVERVARLDEVPSASASGRPAPTVVLARLLPLAARIDPDRSPGDLWFALSRRPRLSPLPEPAPVMHQLRQHYLDLAELAARIARYDRDAAEVVFAPVAARLVGLLDDFQGLGNEGPGLFRAAGAFDARVARAMLDAMPDDPAPPPAGRTVRAADHRHHSKASARIALARTLGLPPELRLREPSRPGVGDDWIGCLDD